MFYILRCTRLPLHIHIYAYSRLFPPHSPFLYIPPPIATSISFTYTFNPRAYIKFLLWFLKMFLLLQCNSFSIQSFCVTVAKQQNIHYASSSGKTLIQIVCFYFVVLYFMRCFFPHIYNSTTRFS